MYLRYQAGRANPEWLALAQRLARALTIQRLPGRLHRGALNADALAGEHTSKGAVKLLPRSWIKNLKLAARLPRSISRFRAC